MSKYWSSISFNKYIQNIWSKIHTHVTTVVGVLLLSCNPHLYHLVPLFTIQS